MPKIFLAYSRRHRPSVERLVESLERISPTIDIWYGDRNIQPGADVTQSINDAIQQADIFVFCTSAAPSFTREGIVLAQEKQKALERFESDRNFRVINVVFGQIEHMPSSFRNFPISALSHPFQNFPTFSFPPAEIWTDASHISYRPHYAPIFSLPTAEVWDRNVDVLVHLRRSCYAIGPPMVDLGYETTSLYSTIDR